MMNQLKAPLNEAEIRQAVEVVQRDAGLDVSAWFETISLDESQRFPTGRGAYVCCYEPSSNRTLSGVVLFEQDSLHDWTVQPTVYAGFHWMVDGFFDENPTMDMARR